MTEERIQPPLCGVWQQLVMAVDHILTDKWTRWRPCSALRHRGALHCAGSCCSDPPADPRLSPAASVQDGGGSLEGKLNDRGPTGQQPAGLEALVSI